MKDHQIEELKAALAGTVKAEGKKGYQKWEINTSSILSKLIKETGRWCSDYASDLFISWNEIQGKLNNGSLGTETFIFAFRDSGVDHKPFYEFNKDNPNYYRAVWCLDVSADEREIKMVLHKSN